MIEPLRTTATAHAAALQPNTQGQREEAMQALAHIFASMFEGLPHESAIATEAQAA